MELSNTTQYVLRLLNYINTANTKKLYCAKFLSEELDINYKFLTSIMTKLVKAEFIESIRGREGGFKLLKDPDKIYIIDIITLFDSSFQKEFCILGIDKCNEGKKCSMHDKWKNPKKQLYEMFETSTLEDLKNKGNKF